MKIADELLDWPARYWSEDVQSMASCADTTLATALRLEAHAHSLNKLPWLT